MKKIKFLVAACALCFSLCTQADVVTAYVSGNGRIDVALSNSTPYVALQMDLTLPVGCSLAS